MTKNTAQVSSHYIGTIISQNNEKLLDCSSYLDFLHPLFEKHNVQNLGVLSHIFENSSFSLVVMLAESHISVHTWPEKKCVQLDVFLCNYEQNNTEVGKLIFEEMISYFDPTEQFVSVVERL